MNGLSPRKSAGKNRSRCGIKRHTFNQLSLSSLQLKSKFIELYCINTWITNKGHCKSNSNVRTLDNAVGLQHVRAPLLIQPLSVVDVLLSFYFTAVVLENWNNINAVVWQQIRGWNDIDNKLDGFNRDDPASDG